MVQHVSSWVNGIILTIVIATIIEMILPNGNNKKYIKTVLGIYVMFSIIGPIVENINKKNYNFNTVLNGLDKIPEHQAFANDSIELNSSIEQIYRRNLEEDIKTKLKVHGYDVTITALSLNLVSGENYGKINQINIKLNKRIEQERISKIDKVDISISDQHKDLYFSDLEKEDIKQYISEEYKVEKNKINIL